MVPVALDEISPALKRRAQGATEIAQLREVVSDVRHDDDGGTTIVLTFVLADPPAGADTWPVDELWELRRIAREVVPKVMATSLENAARERGVSIEDLPSIDWAVEFKPEHMPSLAPDDESLEFEG